MQSERRADTWAELARWDSPSDLTLALDRVFEKLDGIDRGAVLYDYIDPDAVTAVFEAQSADRGANELRFDCEGHEIRIVEDGSIAARSSPGRRTYRR